MKCLHCGKRLALLRKLTGGEFCTDAHRRAYQKEHEKLALGRLRDAQKRLLGVAVPEVADANQTVPPGLGGQQSDEMRGFLPQATMVRLAGGARRIDCGPELNVFLPILPEREVQWNAYHSPAMGEAWSPQPQQVEIPRRDCSEPAIGFPWVPEHPSSRAHRLECRGIAEGSAEAWPVGHVSPAPRLESECGGQELEPMPVQRVITIPFIALDWLPEVGKPGPQSVAAAALGAGAAAQAVESASAPFQTRPTVGRPLELSPVSEVRYEEQPPAGDQPGLASLMESPMPEVAEHHGVLRRVRPRELFFPLPRLGHLPSLAAQVAGNSMQATAYQGTRGKSWIPDRVPMSFRLAVADNKNGRGATGLECQAAPAGHGPVVLCNRTAALANPCLHTAGETGWEYLYCGNAARSAVLPVGIVESCDLVLEKPAAPPAPPLRWSSVCLSAAATLLEVPRMVRGGVPIVAVQPVAELAEGPAAVFASTAGLITPASAAHSITPAERMSQIRISVPNSGQERFWIEPELQNTELATAGAALHRVAPASKLAGEFSLSEDNSVFPLPLHVAQSTAAHSTVLGELAPLWADLPKTHPRMVFAVVEDSEMREAARAFSAVMAMEKNKPWLSHFRLPQFSVQFSAGDLKWLMMSVPVILLLGVYTLTERNGPVGVSHLPPVDRDLAEEAIAPARTENKHAVSMAQTKGSVEEPRKSNAASREVRASTQTASVAAEDVTLMAGRRDGVKPDLAKLDSARRDTGNDGMFGGIRQSILRRAAISMSDDFRSGLGDWEGKGDWSRAWSYDEAGFLRAGPLAVFKPSLGLTDYRMEFLGQIEKKAISWVFRAGDLSHYYAAKVMISEGPLPRAVVEHWAVIGGKETARVRRPVPFQMQRDSFYRYRMDVSGNGFTLSIQGQVVDHWGDDSLKVGGIGFLSAKGELSRLRWVELSHQYDFLGRLCAFLSPYGLPSRETGLR